MSTQQAGHLGQGLAPGAAAGAPSEQLREPLSRETRFQLSVPATSANLGPGYDSLGLALEWRDQVQVIARPRRNPADADVDVVVIGEGAAELPSDASHLVIAAVERILAAKGYLLPDLEVRAENTIPHSRGLGSSAAAIATAVMTADQLIPGGLTEDEQLQIGSRIEGHPDNYVPALRGGVAVSWTTGDTSEPVFKTAPLAVHPELTCVLAVPTYQQSTQIARDLLPGRVSHEHAAKNSSRAALLVHAITAEPALLLDATEDYLHQQYRRQAFPLSLALVEALRDQGLAAVISGAGPAVLVLTLADQAETAVSAIRSFCAEHPGDDTFVPRNLPIARSGATVEPLR
ncbi:homoserine kinase [Nesterenkonia muleiensis]|uniref:homoserine kinase n=1 Tax=Nesterenkonia muleiensis TaxID=2282648 RepID=UPI0013002569|nr:homoserine kinase [Nesterenkonia muleiensis]